MCLDLLFASVFFVSGIEKKNDIRNIGLPCVKQPLYNRWMICIFQEQNNNYYHYDC